MKRVLALILILLTAVGAAACSPRMPAGSASSASSAGAAALPPEPEPVVYGPNVMDIDFDALIAAETDKSVIAMHEYFRDRAPTMENEYTGLFEGCNLIMITAEGFSPYAIREDVTPTLWKMQQEGFRFTNFHTAAQDDTITGEFEHVTGLIPSAGVPNHMKKVKDNLLPFTMGAQFQKLGVRTYAYHPHSYTFYDRNQTHSNLGYDVFRGNRGGVVDGVDSREFALPLENPKYWPESDLEAVQSSFAEYAGKADGKPFHAYYMSVSGHCDYSWDGNRMSRKNREAVEGLELSEKCKAYVAANAELDRALEWLMAELEKTGQLERTVFCVTPDHTPQMISYSEMEELAGRELEKHFEYYESVFLLYCAGYKDAPEVSVPANTIDIIPTLSNLFGFDYDSRLLFGRDLLDPDAEQLITFYGRSWMTDKGKYIAGSKKFVPAEGVVFASEDEQKAYVDAVNAKVKAMFEMSAGVIKKDYYRKLFGE
ncbi:MAG: LTA synthase family protein [Clostridia bacterium]|nr:LTA synthase family protein [Clostridia bacterium]